MQGHAECLRFMQKFNLPMLLLGGGGYKITSVARCWAHETGVVLGEELSDDLPPNDYYESFGAHHGCH